MTHDSHILSVSALTAAIKGTLEGSFPFVWVRGQVVNLSRPPSGHVYFSLRDETSSLAAVWFKGNQKPGEQFDPLTGEVYEDGPRPSLAGTLENGQEIVCAGRLAVYGARGIYQMVVELAQDAGLGRLHEEFERLREKLDALGYFAKERKRPLPENPRRIAILTAPQGAAIQDFLRIAETRGTGAEIRIYPCPVQGDAAPPKLVQALEQVVQEDWAEAVVLIRGGGSLEDLWAFNNEALARAIFTSPVPVLAGIGHEVDFTLADMTADVRAATPTHAAQLLWPARSELFRQTNELYMSLQQAEDRFLLGVEQRLRAITRDLEWRSPQRTVLTWAERLASGLHLLQAAGTRFLERKKARLESYALTLARTPERIPPKVAHYAAYSQRLRIAGQYLLEGKTRTLQQLESSVARAQHKLPAQKAAFDTLYQQLVFQSERLLTPAERSLERAVLQLEAVNPHAPLARGYALVRKADGTFVQETHMVTAGESLRVLVRDGEIAVRVEGEPK